MKILIAADGSAYTKRMLAFIAAHDEWLGPQHSYTVLHCVPAIPHRAAAFVGGRCRRSTKMMPRPYSSPFVRSLSVTPWRPHSSTVSVPQARRSQSLRTNRGSTSSSWALTVTGRLPDS